MMLQMLQLIGKYIVEDKSPIEVLVDEQKEYKSDVLLTITVDPVKDSIDDTEFTIEQYDDEKRYLYLRGTIGSGGSSLSPSMNISLDKIKGTRFLDFNPNQPLKDWIDYFRSTEKLYDQLSKAMNFEQNLVKGLSKPALIERNENSIEKRFFVWIQDNIELLPIITFRFLFNHYMSIEKSGELKINKGTPNTIIFKIKKGQDIFYPGEIEEFVQLYLDLNDEKYGKLAFRSVCYTCNKPNDNLLQPNIGIFNLDMSGFVIGFHDRSKNNAKTVQYTVCTNCDTEIKTGFHFVENNLKFYAYRTAKGTFGKDGQLIFHYLIPVITDPDILQKTIYRIIQAKTEIGEEKKKGLMKRITSLDGRLKSANRARRTQIIREVAQLKKIAQSDVSQIGESPDLIELLSKLANIPVNYLDIYYFVTDPKQNPSTKEVIGFYQVPSTVISKIAGAYNLMSRERRYFQFYKIRELVPEKLFLTLLNAMYQEQQLDPREFFFHSNEVAQTAFKNKLYTVGKKSQSLGYILMYFKQSHEFLIRTGVFN